MKYKLLLFISILFAKLLISQTCRSGSQTILFSPNNVKTGLANGGELFGSIFENGYTVDINSLGQKSPTVFFASSIWVGAKLKNGESRFCGTTYRDRVSNFDFYPGPLDPDGSTMEDNCKNWDKFFEVTKQDLRFFKTHFNGEIFTGISENQIPDNIKYWPAKGNPFWNEANHFELPNQDLATFFDYDKNGLYNPLNGDFPLINTSPVNDPTFKPSQLMDHFPSKIVFWIINDNGGPHLLSTGDALKVEIHNYAYGFEGDEDINNTTFYTSRIFYKGNEEIEELYYGIWSDPDLGCHDDDYVGTDTIHHLMYVYNADSIDGDGISCVGGVPKFESEIPIVAIKVLEGLKEKPQKRYGMTSTIYMNRAGAGFEPPTYDPENIDQQFIDFFRGRWKDGNPIVASGSGYDPNLPDSFNTKFVFTDPPNMPNGWSMCNNNMMPGDRRMLITSGGKLSMKKGDVNDVTSCVLYTNKVKYPCPDITSLQILSEKIDSFYNNQTNSLVGPDAPLLTDHSINNKITISLNPNFAGSNNVHYQYKEKIPNENSFYNFEGIRIYQLKTKDISPLVYNTSQAIEIFQADIKNDVKEIYNWYYNSVTKNWDKKLVVNGENKGIPAEITLDKDFFTNEPLNNNTPYYYTIIAYGYNNYQDFDPIKGLGQSLPYLPSMQNLQKYVFIPLPSNELGLSTRIKRISGVGVNKGKILELDKAYTHENLDGSYENTLTYKQDKGPFDVIILDPSKADRNGIYEVRFSNFNNHSKVCEYDTSSLLTITELNSGAIIYNEPFQSRNNDILIEELGIKLSFNYDNNFPDIDYFNFTTSQFKPTELYNYTVGESYKYALSNNHWYSALTDNSSLNKSEIDKIFDPVLTDDKTDSDIPLSKIKEGYFFPFALSKIDYLSTSPFYLSTTNSEVHQIAIDKTVGTLKLKNLNNVDVIFTSDKSKWSRCIVVETASSFYAAKGFATLDNARTLEVRKSPSVDKNGNPDNSGTGFSWFPGYAVDIETGKKLNIFFGENTALRSSLGNYSYVTDMIFNPSNIKYDSTQSNIEVAAVAGGHHCIYVTSQPYDECKDLSTKLKIGTNSFNKKNPMGAITWTSFPVLQEGNNLLSINEGLIPNDLKVELRVPNNYSKEWIVEISKISNCNTQPEDAVYQFTIEETLGLQTPKSNASFIRGGLNYFMVENDKNLDLEISISSLNSSIKEIYHTNQTFTWQANESNVESGFYIVTVRSKNGEYAKMKLVVIE